ncbi:hypothetical protein ANME2D_00081 [Candidatus Methanoperedens nitroreducens]|uniref:Uncharacterized protein n=1 Tax=Candidatus Methanoperedens nitratireducens TaxID=1392998 RepID=A0A062V6U7_9EURY|nr:hypothetical protein [Candidatus Methanoperedens nitroreducens]KCZ73022.1 hypothetical protein ANME2D_00081 [Candidatus Methanoperedens nitroreducens]MDJ1423034.1 hypothetical protein [Candidatus Methanoperedens sp.]
MSTERDIIIERLEQKLAARDKEIEKMQESLKESILIEMEKRFADKIKLRESTLDEIRVKFGEKINEIIEMNKSLRNSILEQKKPETDAFAEAEKRMDRIERRLVELNSAYDGVMKELLDQKSIIQEFTVKKKGKEETKIPIKEGAKSPDTPKSKGEYIVASNYTPQDKRKEQKIIEAEERTIISDSEEEVQLKRPQVRRSERVKEGVEIFETPRKR